MAWNTCHKVMSLYNYYICTKWTLDLIGIGLFPLKLGLLFTSILYTVCEVQPKCT